MMSCRYSWTSRDIEDAENASLLLAADVIYSDDLTDAFFCILERLMSRGSTKVYVNLVLLRLISNIVGFKKRGKKKWGRGRGIILSKIYNGENGLLQKCHRSDLS